MLKIDEVVWVRAAAGDPQPPGTLFHQQELLQFGPSSSFEAALVLILCGAADILNEDARIVVSQRKNFGVLGAPLNKPISKKKIASALEVVDLDGVVLDKYLQRSRAQQRYYKEILLEAVYFFWRTKRKNHVMGFLHLYRFLERISYVFPITYAISSEDFRGTYESFKKFVSGDTSGELKFFQHFQKECIDKDLRRASTRLNFGGLPYGGEFAGFNLVKKFIDERAVVSESAVELSFHSEAITGLAINLRNRFFHAGSGHSDNISLVELTDPDGFFGVINEALINWLSIVYFQTLISKVDRYR